jgi:putative transposase
MPRPNRQCAGGTVYHVINRANGKLMIFKKPSDFLAFERILAQGLARVDMRLCGYCIMGNHWHLLLWPREDGDLSTFMQWITNTHSKRWHTAHGTTGIGHVYQGRFKSFPLQASEHYLKVLQYIESNPLRAKLVEDSNAWQYSSLAIRNGLEKLGLNIYKGPVKLPPNWNKDVNIIPDETSEAVIQNCITRGAPYGGKTWTKTISQKLGIESTLTPRGRPKKITHKTS